MFCDTLLEVLTNPRGGDFSQRVAKAQESLDSLTGNGGKIKFKITSKELKQAQNIVNLARKLDHLSKVRPSILGGLEQELDTLLSKAGLDFRSLDL